MYKLYLDLDGIFAAFEKRVFELTKKEWHPSSWGKVDKVPHFFYSLDPMPGAKEFFDALISFNLPTQFLTAAPRPTEQLYSAAADKIRWVREKLDTKIPVHCSLGWERKIFYVEPGAILIDDALRNIEHWEKHGGIGIHHTSNENTLRNLEYVLLMYK